MTHGHLPKEEAERVVEAMRRLRDDQYKTNAALARVLGRSGASVGDILAATPKSAPTYATAVRVAALLGVEAADLLAGRSKESASDEYPARARALARLRGLLGPEVESLVRAVTPHDMEPLTELEWVRMALIQADELERNNRLKARLMPPRSPRPPPPRTKRARTQ